MMSHSVGVMSLKTAAVVDSPLTEKPELCKKSKLRRNKAKTYSI